MRASIVVVIHSGRERLDDAVASLEPWGAGGAAEVIVVDNGSPDGVAEAARRRFPWATVVRSDANLGFAGGVRRGVEAASWDVLCLLNDDAAAGEGWLEAHLEALDAHPEAAASAGLLTSWDGRRVDFTRPVVTFDAHAFQLDQGAPLDEVELPEPGEPVPLACGGNMAIRRADWERAGGFDPALFAYFEDLELGWRLLALGREIVATPGARARHRGAATSDAMGNYRRGVLFERNALRVFFSTADAAHRAALGNAVLLTFLHRLVAFAGEEEATAAATRDPFGLEASSAPGGHVPGMGAGLGRLFRRAAPSPPEPVLRGLLLMQLQAASGFFEGFEGTTARWRALQAARTVTDREILERFPRLIVPTYAGDEAWFGSEGFSSLLPGGWPLEHRALDEVIRR
ncbi:MAG TPA: glycosyltransferase family 2 protein [Acidobacteria bacterium]|nr:glycosyltransferase family 2 protein [Acidobacteriota bacterium]